MKLYKVTYTNDCLDESVKNLLLESPDVIKLKNYALKYAKEIGVNNDIWDFLDPPTMGDKRIVRTDKQKLHLSLKEFLLIE